MLVGHHTLSRQLGRGQVHGKAAHAISLRWGPRPDGLTRGAALPLGAGIAEHAVEGCCPAAAPGRQRALHGLWCAVLGRHPPSFGFVCTPSPTVRADTVVAHDPYLFYKRGEFQRMNFISQARVVRVAGARGAPRFTAHALPAAARWPRWRRWPQLRRDLLAKLGPQRAYGVDGGHAD